MIRVLFRFLIDRILFRVLSDRVFFDSSVIESSSGFADIDSSMLFFHHIAIFYQIVLRFFSKTDILFYIHCMLKNSLSYFNWLRKKEWIEAVVQRWSVKNVFLEISQNSLENTFDSVSFLTNLQNTSGGWFWMKKYVHDKDTKYIKNICHQFPDLHILSNSQLKSGSHLPKKIVFICFNDSPSKIIKKALFVLKIIKFLSWLFEHVEKTAWLKKYG